jgi:hypothetical protein
VAATLRDVRSIDAGICHLDQYLACFYRWQRANAYLHATGIAALAVVNEFHAAG